MCTRRTGCDQIAHPAVQRTKILLYLAKVSQQFPGHQRGGLGHEQASGRVLAAQGFKRVDVELHRSRRLIILEHGLHGRHDLLVPGVQSAVFREHLR